MYSNVSVHFCITLAAHSGINPKSRHVSKISWKLVTTCPEVIVKRLWTSIEPGQQGKHMTTVLTPRVLLHSLFSLYKNTVLTDYLIPLSLINLWRFSISVILTNVTSVIFVAHSLVDLFSQEISWSNTHLYSRLSAGTQYTQYTVLFKISLLIPLAYEGCVE